MKRGTKKSVSFQAHIVEGNEEKMIQLEVPGENKSLIILPFHLPLVLFGMFQSGLTDDQLVPMVKGLANLTLLQVVYGYFLAGAGSSQPKPTGNKKSKSSSENVGLLVISCTVISLILANGMFLALILFGAPLYGFLKETYVLACHLSLIVLQPLLIIFKLDFQQLSQLLQSDVLFQTVSRNQILCSCFSALVGGWLGVIPIPLDWDRPWQQWPITILTGSYLGATLGSIIGYVFSTQGKDQAYTPR